MASENENSHVGLVELEELEAIEIDEALLREFLEEQDDVGGGDAECPAESVENGNKMMDKKEEDQKQQKQKQKISCSEQREGCNNVHEFESVNNMIDMEPMSRNDDMILNWYPDDIGMMVDFGYANGEFCSQICESLVSYEASYGCLWEDL